mmetsp:Transcript_17909/g.38100  ORF Transcript_17909/g.38100 Transcript_17909/m.38100 type:complete len:177 (-) Transcript_17909:32-562(-)
MSENTGSDVTTPAAASSTGAKPVSKKTVSFSAIVAQEKSFDPSEPGLEKKPDRPSLNGHYVAYDPAGVPETFDIYTGSSKMSDQKRKSEDAVLAVATAEAASRNQRAAQAIVSATGAFTAANSSAGRNERSRTALVATGAVSRFEPMEIQHPRNVQRSQPMVDRCAENCAQNCTMM